MDSIDKQDVIQAIDTFLATQLANKLEPELKKQQQLKEGDSEKAEKIAESIARLEAKFAKPAWLEDAATRMAGQLKFGTHISKGVHPDSKGDNVNFQRKDNLPEGAVGSQLLPEPALDANGNAAALPLAAFFSTEVKGTKLRDLIQAQHPAVDGVFADDQVLSQTYAQQFKAALDNTTEQAASNERNKQLLWPMGNDVKQAIDNSDYTCVVPLYPSALAHHVYLKLNDMRFSDDAKLARKNRGKKNAEQMPYVSVPDLAMTKLGGTKPQNVSQLMSKQGGRNYLLPSLPPLFSTRSAFTVSNSDTQFFNARLRYQCRFAFKQLYDVILQERNTVHVRDARQHALGLILEKVLSLAADVQKKQKGWTMESSLEVDQQYWLDPHRGELEGQADFARQRQTLDWVDTIEKRFAAWVNHDLRKKFPRQKDSFDDAEFKEWRGKMTAAIKASQRLRQGVFQ